MDTVTDIAWRVAAERLIKGCKWVTIKETRGLFTSSLMVLAHKSAFRCHPRPGPFPGYLGNLISS